MAVKEKPAVTDCRTKLGAGYRRNPWLALCSEVLQAEFANAAMIRGFRRMLTGISRAGGEGPRKLDSSLRDHYAGGRREGRIPSAERAVPTLRNYEGYEPSFSLIWADSRQVTKGRS